MSDWEAEHVVFHKYGDAWIRDNAIEAVTPDGNGGSRIHTRSGLINVNDLKPGQVMDRMMERPKL